MKYWTVLRPLTILEGERRISAHNAVELEI